MNDIKKRMRGWKATATLEEGFHCVISPEISDCKVSYIYVLNMKAGRTYTLESNDKEMNAILIKGKCKLKEKNFDVVAQKKDAFYVPGGSTVEIEAIEDCNFYIGGAICEGIGQSFFREFDLTQKLGDVHQIHGKGSCEREVMFTLNHQVPASKLICGVSWGNEGGWTSFPPHQHENDLEEVYCYFDMDEPDFGLHLSYLKEGEVDDIVAHVVRSGDMVLAPCGYHPTVASPGTKNTYFWVLTAFCQKSRRYDLAILDKNFSYLVGGE